MRLTLDRDFLLHPERPRFTVAPNSDFSPWSFSRHILETGSGYAADGGSAEIPRNVDSFLQVWSPSQQRDLLQQWGDRLPELVRLSQERNTKLYFKSLLAFGFHCEKGGRSDLAAKVYTALKEQSDFPDLQRRATEQLQAAQGNGPIGASMGLWLQRLSHQASDPWMFLPMGLAGPAFRVTRLGILGRFLASPAAGFWTRGFAAEAVAGLGALAVENSVFTVSARGLREVFGQPSPLALGHDWVMGGAMLSGLRLGGWVGDKLHRGLLSAEILSLGLREGLPLSWFQQGGVLAGILLNQEVEMRFGSRPDTGWADRLVDGLGTLANSHMAGQLSRRVGEPWQHLEQEFAFRSQQFRIQARPGFPGLSFRFGNARPLAWEAALKSAAPRVISGMDEAHRLNHFIVSDDGNNGTNPDYTMTDNGPLPETRSIDKVSASEPPLPGDADLLGMFRESFEVYPHAASIFELGLQSLGTGELQWGNILKINPRFTETFGYLPEEVVGRSLLSFLHPKERSHFETLPAMLLHDGASKLNEVHFQRKDGGSIWCNLTSALKHGNGRTLGFSFIEDVSSQRLERLRNAEQLRVAVAQLNELREAGEYLAHDSNNALAVSRIHVSATQGYIQDLGELARDFRPPNNPSARTNNAYQAFLERLSAIHTSIIATRPHTSPMPPADSKIHDRVGEMFDILDANLQVVREQDEWIRSLIQGFRELAEEEKEGPPFNLHVVLKHQKLRSILGEKPKLDIILGDVPDDPDPWLVRGLPKSLGRVIENLVENARDAMVDRPAPALRVETAKVSLSEQDLLRLAAHSPGIPLDIAAGDFLHLSISDTGSGMDAETLRRIFEPRFSTKPKHSGGHGGLGLAITDKLVRRAGFMTVESTLGEGSTFNSYLQRVHTTTKTDPPSQPLPPAQVQYIPPK